MFFDDFSVIEAGLIGGLMLLIVNDGGNAFDQDGEVILSDVVLLQKVVQFVDVPLIPDEIDDCKDTEDEVEVCDQD